MHIVSPISLLIRRICRRIPLRRRLILLMLFARVSIRLSLLRSSWLILLRRKHLVLHCSAPLHLTYQFYSRPLSILTDLATHLTWPCHPERSYFVILSVSEDSRRLHRADPSLRSG